MFKGLPALASLLLWQSLPAQNCDVLPPQSDFTFEVLADNLVGNAFDLQVDAALRVYWVERKGALKVYDPQSQSVHLIRQFDVHTGPSGWERDNEGGLQGIALDGNFMQNRRIYLYYSVPPGELNGQVLPNQPGPVERLSRFTLSPDFRTLQPGSEKVIFEHEILAQCCHHGGDLNWGPDGNLWLSTGDNNNPEYSNEAPLDESLIYRDVRATAGNTLDWRGKILRLRPLPIDDNANPTPGIGSTYEIPEGNLFPANDTTARPEIYSMGLRNPFSFSIRHDNLWIGLGEASGAFGEDEINLITAPGFFGWPFFSGNQIPYQPENYPIDAGHPDPFNPSGPRNDSPYNTGKTFLPRAIPPVLAPQSTATRLSMACMGIALSWIRFDSTLQSEVKFPPALHNKLLVTSYGLVPIHAVTFDAAGDVISSEALFNPVQSYTQYLHRAVQGPDGALYLARGEYTFDDADNSKIIKVSYTGDCAYTTSIPKRFTSPEEARTFRPLLVHHRGIASTLKVPEGARIVELYNMRGQLVWRLVRPDPEPFETLTLPAHLERGLLQARFRL